MNEIFVRKASRGDIPDIQRLYQQLDHYHADLIPMVFRKLDTDVRKNEVIQDWIDRDDADYLVAEMAGEVIGFLSVEKSKNPDFAIFKPHQYAMVEGAVVDETWRGKGVGTSLLEAVVDWARARELRYIQSTVWHSNASAWEFYARHGFRPLTTRIELDTEQTP